MVTVLDGHPHTLAFLSSINRVPLKSLGASRFGHVGSLDAVYRYHGVDTDSILRAALDVADGSSRTPTWRPAQKRVDGR